MWIFIFSCWLLMADTLHWLFWSLVSPEPPKQHCYIFECVFISSQCLFVVFFVCLLCFIVCCIFITSKSQWHCPLNSCWWRKWICFNFKLKAFNSVWVAPNWCIIGSCKLSNWNQILFLGVSRAKFESGEGNHKTKHCSNPKVFVTDTIRYQLVRFPTTCYRCTVGKSLFAPEIPFALPTVLFLMVGSIFPSASPSSSSSSNSKSHEDGG